mmetsp:Transcript_3789/g.5856  ORF Transcript_3789/g.5856 Transcript_3789/m.5856 type:complete len:112 (-) Transcript_3789:861-1196(-)
MRVLHTSTIRNSNPILNPKRWETTYHKIRKIMITVKVQEKNPPVKYALEDQEVNFAERIPRIRSVYTVQRKETEMEIEIETRSTLRSIPQLPNRLDDRNEEIREGITARMP